MTNDEIDALDTRLLAEGRLDVVIARHYDDLRDRARVRLRDAAQADDVLHEALERVVGELRRGKRHGHPIRVVLHMVLGWTIAAAFTRGRHPEPDLPLDERDRATDDEFGAVEARDWFERATAVLPDRDREVMRMRFAQGLEVAEIAAALDVTANAVYQAIHRGRRALRPAEAG